MTFVVPIVFVVAMLTVFTLQYFDVEQRDVYPFEQRSDRVSLNFICLGNFCNLISYMRINKDLVDWQAIFQRNITVTMVLIISTY